MAAAGDANAISTALHQLALEPSENWDDDFEFQQGNGHASTSTGRSKAKHPRARAHAGSGGDVRKLSVASSVLTEDWDADADVDELGRVLGSSSSALPPPRTPEEAGDKGAGRGQGQGETETENWDDDFEDARNSPQKGRTRAGSLSLLQSQSHPLAGAGSAASPTREESWDDEYDNEQEGLRHPHPHPHPHEEDDFHDDEFGLYPDGGDEDEEDRTVTAKSRRAVRARPPLPLPLPLPSSSSSGPSHTHTTPPPPVPSLPQGLFPHPPPPLVHRPTSTHTHTNRSPSSSVFSVPNTIATAHTYSSTAHLRPTSPSSPSSAAFPSTSTRNPYAHASGFALLPPSPPIHKERERRRLRKKSRPRPGPREGMFELVSVGVSVSVGGGSGIGSTDSLGQRLGGYERERDRRRFSVDEEVDEGFEEDEMGLPSGTVEAGVYDASPLSDVSSGDENAGSGSGGQPQSASQTQAQAQAQPREQQQQTQTQTLAYFPQPPTVPATPTKSSGATGLLSRIGSVKKWGAGVGRRRRGASVTPSEVIDSQQNERTPRPQSSMSSFHASSSSHQPPQPPLPSSSNATGVNLSTPKTMLKPKRHSTNSAGQRSTSVSGSPSGHTGGGGGWFFRASSAGSPHARAGAGIGVGVGLGSGSGRTGGAAGSSTGLSRGLSTRTTSSARSGHGSEDGRSKSRSRSRAGSRARGGRGGDAGDADAAFFESGSGAGFGGGRGNGNGNGSKTQLEFQLRGAAVGGPSNTNSNSNSNSNTATPSKLIKRKSLGFVKLGFGGGGGGESAQAGAGGGSGRGRYEGIGLGRAVVGGGAGQVEGDGGGEEEPKQEVVVDVPERSRRKSFSRLLRDRGGGGGGGGDNLRAPSVTSTTSTPQPSSPFIFVDTTPGSLQAPATPTPHSNLKEKEREGSRGFISSMRKLSLVGMGAGGRHKRSKSGGAALDGHGALPPVNASSTPIEEAAGAEVEKVFGGKENRKTSFSSGRAGGGGGGGGGNGNGNVPYSLPPLPASAAASASQLSLRLPSNSTSNLGSVGMGAGRRMVSSSSQSQSQSRRSSVLPASSTSASSSAAVSRAPSLSRERERITPGSAGRGTGASGGGGSARRGRVSEEGPRRSSIGVAAGGGRSRSSLDFDFGAQILQAGVRERERLEKEKAQEKEKAKLDELEAMKPNTAAPVLLPPIELQPPSPPRTVTSATAPVHRSRTSIDMQMFENPSTSLGSAFSLNPPAGAGASQSAGALSPTTSTSSIFFTPNSSPSKSAGAGGNKLAVVYSPGKSPGSQQSASLGRATAASGVAVGPEGGGTGGGTGSGNVGGSAAPPRRNSLGDLKIPARISQAQVGLRRDLGMVREFATNIEQLKELMDKYNTLVSEVQAILDTHAQRHAQLALAAAAPPQRATSPSFFANLSAKAKTRGRSNTNPSSAPPILQAQASPPEVTTSQFAYKDMASAFYTINSRYRISWECAELLIELGGGPASADAAGNGSASASAASPPLTSASVPMMRQTQGAVGGGGGGEYDANATPNGKRGRERAVTLAGDEGKPSVPAPLPPASTHATTSSPSTSVPQPLASPPNNTSSWRASTGRHDLSHRQLVLLREMLNNSNATAAVDAEDSHLSIPEDTIPPARQSLQALSVNRDWRWGDARNSTITLPSEESTGYRFSTAQGEGGSRRVSTEKDKDKKRGGRMGMTGIRDMLRALKRSHIEGVDADIDQSAASQRTAPSAYHSTTSLSTQSSAGSRSRHRYPHPRVPSQLRRRGKSSTGPESVRSTTKPRSAEQDQYSPPPFNPVKPSPRRPSLASIFRIGNKNRPPSVAVPDSSATDAGTDADGYAPTPSSGGTATGGEDSSSTGEEDWDRMDSASDLDAAARALGIDGAATVRGLSESRRRGGVVVKGKSPYLHRESYPPPLPHPLPSVASSAGYSQAQTQSQSNLHSVIPKRSFTASQSSLWTSEQYQQQHHQGSPLGTSHMPTSRTTRLSNVEEHSDDPVAHPRVSSHPIATSPRPGSSRSHNNAHPNLKTGSVRSIPPQLAAAATMPLPGLSSDVSKLAMTPENIKPLLENAKEVHARLADCIDEIQGLLERTTLGG